MEDINEWVLKRKRAWNEHVNRMEGESLERIAMDKFSVGERGMGRLTKRWSDNISFDEYTA